MKANLYWHHSVIATHFWMSFIRTLYSVYEQYTCWLTKYCTNKTYPTCISNDAHCKIVAKEGEMYIFLRGKKHMCTLFSYIGSIITVKTKYHRFFGYSYQLFCAQLGI